MQSIGFLDSALIFGDRFGKIGKAPKRVVVEYNISFIHLFFFSFNIQQVFVLC